MAMAKFVLTASITVPGDVLALISGGFGTASGTEAAGHYGSCGATWPAGTAIMMDTATTAGAALQAAIGAGNLRAYVPGTDDVGHAALAN